MYNTEIVAYDAGWISGVYKITCVVKFFNTHSDNDEPLEIDPGWRFGFQRRTDDMRLPEKGLSPSMFVDIRTDRQIFSAPICSVTLAQYQDYECDPSNTVWMQDFDTRDYSRRRTDKKEKKTARVKSANSDTGPWKSVLEIDGFLSADKFPFFKITWSLSSLPPSPTPQPDAPVRLAHEFFYDSMYKPVSREFSDVRFLVYSRASRDATQFRVLYANSARLLELGLPYFQDCESI